MTSEGQETTEQDFQANQYERVLVLMEECTGELTKHDDFNRLAAASYVTPYNQGFSTEMKGLESNWSVAFSRMGDNFRLNIGRRFVWSTEQGKLAIGTDKMVKIVLDTSNKINEVVFSIRTDTSTDEELNWVHEAETDKALAHAEKFLEYFRDDVRWLLS